jgi:hypothetical protein
MDGSNIRQQRTTFCTVNRTPFQPTLNLIIDLVRYFADRRIFCDAGVRKHAVEPVFLTLDFERAICSRSLFVRLLDDVFAGTMPRFRPIPTIFASVSSFAHDHRR